MSTFQINPKIEQMSKFTDTEIGIYFRGWVGGFADDIPTDEDVVKAIAEAREQIDLYNADKASAGL